MDSLSNGKCKKIFEEALKSNFGKYITNFFKENENFELIFPIPAIRKKLDEQAYKSPKDFLNDVKNKFCNASRAVGHDSEISFVILTVLKLITDETNKIIEIEKLDLKDKINSIATEIRKKQEKMPDSLEEFQEILSQQSDLPCLDPVYSITSERPFKKMDVDALGLYEKLLALPSDEDVDVAIDLITRYEALGSNDQDELIIDMSMFQPYTVRILQEYIDKIENKKEEPKQE